MIKNTNTIYLFLSFGSNFYSLLRIVRRFAVCFAMADNQLSFSSVFWDMIFFQNLD